MVHGLTSDDLVCFHDILIKANDLQARALLFECAKEVLFRDKLSPDNSFLPRRCKK